LGRTLYHFKQQDNYRTQFALNTNAEGPLQRRGEDSCLFMILLKNENDKEKLFGANQG
jgi:hypothetical protein